MEIRVRREDDAPLHSQIALELRQQIESGALGPGARLPSSRELAAQLGVNRTTVVQAFRELQSAGLIESGVGRGSFVAPASPRAPGDAESSATDHSIAGNAWRRALGDHTPPSLAPAPTDLEGEPPICLSRAVAQAELFPVDLLREQLDAALDQLGPRAFDYAPPAGYEPLREEIARKLERSGVDLSEREVLVTNGSQQGLDLIVRLLRPGSRVLTSTPTFSGALRVLGRSHTCIGAALDEHGLVPSSVHALAREHRPQLLYTIPFCHNPTGTCAPDERLGELYRVAAEHGVPVLEDDWLGDLREANDPAPLAARDDRGLVITMGTVSKVLAPGLRLGWLVVPREVFPDLVSLKGDSDLASNLPAQAALALAMATGAFEKHTTRMRQELEKRRRLVSRALQQLPGGAKPLGEFRGMTAWIELPAGVDPALVVEMARREGVAVNAGQPFLPDVAPSRAPGVRVTFAAAPAEHLDVGIARFGRALEATLHHAPLTVPPLV